MPTRKDPLVTGEFYHICTRSISGEEVFRSRKNFVRMMETMDYYRFAKPAIRYSIFGSLDEKSRTLMLRRMKTGPKIVDIIAFCLMDTHIHLLLRQLVDNGITDYLHRILVSYSKHFNKLNKRKGPLWEKRFSNVPIENDDHLLHETRYLHLNPPVKDLVKNPEDWEFSSYLHYVAPDPGRPFADMLDHNNYIDLDIPSYLKFVEEYLPHQRELAKIKRELKSIPV